MSTGVVGKVVDVVADEDGLASVKHGLGVEDVLISVLGGAQVGIVQPIDEDEAEVVLTAAGPARLLVTPNVPAAPPVDPVEAARLRRWGSDA